LLLVFYEFAYKTTYRLKVHVIVFSDTLDAVKQSAALCLLRLIRNAPESVSMSEWSSRVIHLLNDQHMVSCHSQQHMVSK